MADTQRTLAQVLALLADNTSGNISPQDMRDMVVSIIPSGGALYKSGASVATVINTINVPELINVVTTASGLVRNFTVSAAGRLTYTGTIPKTAFISANIAMTAENNKLVGFMFALNGVPINESKISRFIATGADVGALTVSWAVEVTENDYLEVYAVNESDNSNITVEALYFAVSATLK